MTKLRQFLALAVCALLLGSCSTQPAGPNPALWRISDADSTIWLFGTVHVLPPDLAWRTERIDSALASSEALALETDIGPEAEARFAGLAMQYGMAPANRTVAGLLSSGALNAADREKIAALGRDLGMDSAALERLRPWLVALQLSLAEAVRQGQSAEAGVEPALVETARADNKTLIALETPEQQIRTLADLSEADEIAFLRATLRQVEETPETLQALDRAWASGDLDTLERLTEEDLREAGQGVYDALMTRRNTAWAARVRTLLAGDQDVFVAVGAAHLVGDDSLVALLRAQGVTVEGP